MIDLSVLNGDLAVEHEDLDGVLRGLRAQQWDAVTPAPGWMVRDQVSHLAFFDEQATTAVVDPEAFTDALGRVTSVEAFINAPLEKGRSMTPEGVHEWWLRARTEMLGAFPEIDPATRVPWFGPPMSPASFISARLMETWAHGQDIVDTFGSSREPTDRLKHVAHLGVRARRNSYAANGLEMPEGEVRVELTGPSGDVWSWNDSATDIVTGSAVDFCLVVTQRRHLDDTHIVVEGDLAREWMAIAQAFAGPPGEGRRPGQFSKAAT